jgi:hypothetical protein
VIWSRQPISVLLIQHGGRNREPSVSDHNAYFDGECYLRVCYSDVIVCEIYTITVHTLPYTSGHS